MPEYPLADLNPLPRAKGAIANGINLVCEAWNSVPNLLPPTNVAPRTFEKGIGPLARVAPDILNLLDLTTASQTPPSRPKPALPLGPTWLARSVGYATGAQSCQGEITEIERENTFVARAATVFLILLGTILGFLIYQCCQGPRGWGGRNITTQTSSESGTDLSLGAENNDLHKRLNDQTKRCETEKDELQKMLRLIEGRNTDLSHQLTDAQNKIIAGFARESALEKAAIRPIGVNKETQTLRNKQTQASEDDISSQTGILKQVESGSAANEFEIQIAQMMKEKNDLQRQNDGLRADLTRLQRDHDEEANSKNTLEDLLQSFKNVEQTINEINCTCPHEYEQKGASPISSKHPSEKGNDDASSECLTESSIYEEDLDDNSDCKLSRCHECPRYPGQYHHICSKESDSKFEAGEVPEDESKSEDESREKDEFNPKDEPQVADEPTAQDDKSKEAEKSATIPIDLGSTLEKPKHREPIPPTPKVLDIALPPEPRFPAPIGSTKFKKPVTPKPVSDDASEISSTYLPPSSSPHLEKRETEMGQEAAMNKEDDNLDTGMFAPGGLFDNDEDGFSGYQEAHGATTGEQVKGGGEEGEKEQEEKAAEAAEKNSESKVLGRKIKIPKSRKGKEMK